MPSFLEREQINAIQPSIADGQSIVNGFQTKLAYWAAGASSVKSAYNRYLNLSLTNPENQENLKQFMDKATLEMQKVGQTDLSIGDNQSQALGIFDPLTNGRTDFSRNIMGDHSITQFYNDENSLAESYRIKDGGKEWSRNNQDILAMQLNEFRKDSASNWQNHWAGKQGYTPFYDSQKERLELLAKFKPDDITNTLPVPGYLKKFQDKSWREEQIKTYLDGTLSDKAKQQDRIDGMVHYGFNYGRVQQDTLKDVDNSLRNTQDLVKYYTNVQGMKGTTPEQKEMYRQKVSNLQNDINNLQSNYKQLQDTEFVKSNYGSLAERIQTNALTTGMSKAAAHKDIEQTYGADTWQQTILTTNTSKQVAQIAASSHLQGVAMTQAGELNRKLLDLGFATYDFISGRLIPFRSNDLTVPVSTAPGEKVNSFDNFIAKKTETESAIGENYNDLKKSLYNHRIEAGDNKYNSWNKVPDSEVEAYIQTQLKKGIKDPEFDKFQTKRMVLENNMQMYNAQFDKIRNEMEGKGMDIKDIEKSVDGYIKQGHNKVIMYPKENGLLNFSGKQELTFSKQEMLALSTSGQVNKDGMKLTLSYGDGTFDTPQLTATDKNGKQYTLSNNPLNGYNNTSAVGALGSMAKQGYNKAFKDQFNESYGEVNNWKLPSNPKDPRVARAVYSFMNTPGIPADFTKEDISLKAADPTTGVMRFQFNEIKAKASDKISDFKKAIKEGTYPLLKYNEKDNTYEYSGNPDLFKTSLNGLNPIEASMSQTFEGFANIYKPGSVSGNQMRSLKGTYQPSPYGPKLAIKKQVGEDGVTFQVLDDETSLPISKIPFGSFDEAVLHARRVAENASTPIGKQNYQMLLNGYK